MTEWCSRCERRPRTREGNLCQPCRVEVDLAAPTRDARTGLLRDGANGLRREMPALIFGEELVGKSPS